MTDRQIFLIHLALTFDWNIGAITIQSYYWKVCVD